MPIHRTPPTPGGSAEDDVRSVTEFVVLTAEFNDRIDLVTRRMRLFNCGALLVNMEDGGIGILSERDVLRAVADARLHRPIGSLTSRDPISIAAEQSVAEAAAVMLMSGVRHLVVNDRIDGKDRQGIVSMRDLVAPLLGSLQVEMEPVGS